MSVQPLPIDTLALQLERIQRQPLLWAAVSFAERLCAGALLFVLMPPLVIAGVLIIVLSRRSPLIAHLRVGHAGRPIWVLKLRTMWDPGSPWHGSGTLVERLTPERTRAIAIKSSNDPRVTSRFAVLCRRYSIDEFPQLWHVLRGEMALIGPRPLTAAEIETYYSSAADRLLSMKPGLSGLWQIKGRSRLSYLQRRRLDLFMVRNWSLPLYLRILAATIPTVFAGKDAW